MDAPASDDGRRAVGVVALDSIRPNPWQPRISLHEQQLRELAHSIETHGIMQPLVVQPADRDGMYTLIAGERRWRAAALAGLETVPIVELEATPQAMLELAIVENVVRADLSPLEEAHAYQRLIDDFSLTQGEVAERVGKSRVAITNTLRLLKSPDRVQQALVDGLITEGHARALLGLPTIGDQLDALNTVIGKDLTVRKTEDLVRNWQSASRPRAGETRADPHLAQVESRLRDALGTRVSISHQGETGGSITIRYFSDEQLQAIADRVAGEDLW